MSKYTPLTDHLNSLEEGDWRAKFSEIEEILGFSLPESAYLHRPWWANSDSGHSQTNAWQSAGWQTSNVDLQSKEVTFTSFFEALKNLKPDTHKQEIITQPLTIEQAKAGLATHFNLEIENIEIVIRG